MKRLFSILICAVLIVSLFPVIAFAEDTTAATMRLVEHEGSVTVKNASGKTLKITKDMRLYNNYQITTGSKSYAYISLDSSKAIKLDASSKVTISRQGRKLEILVEKGKLLFDVTQPLKKDETLNIRTATMITGVRGTIGWIEVSSSQRSGLYLLEGSTLVTSVDPQNGAETTTSVHSGQVLTSSLSQEGGQDVLDVELTTLNEDETPGFVRVAILEDPEMQQRIAENTDLDVDTIISNAEDTLKQEEKAAEEAQQEIQEKVEQQVTEQTDPLFGESDDPAPSTPSAPSTPPTPVITYTVVFDMNGHGDAVVGQLVQKDGLAVKPTPPTAEGYTFDGWFTEAGCINEWDFNRNTVSGNLTLYAKWTINRYTVSFDLNGHGDAITAQTVFYSRFVTEPTEPTADGLVFGGWFKEKECVNRWDFDSDTVSADTTLYAKWSASSCTVSFEMNGHGNSIASQTITYGSLVTEPAAPAAEGFAFEGWFTDPELLNQWDFDSDTVTSDLTLYAKWSVKTYQITFNMNGYGSAVPPQTVAHGALVTEPARPAVDGMIFGGWFKETDCITPWDFSADTITADTTLYAKWTVKTYTVTFNMNGHGDPVTSQTITHGGTVTEPVLPTAEGFIFEGWFMDPDFTDQWDFTKNTVTSNTILYAKWTEIVVEPEPKPVTFTVSFDLNGHGDPIEPQTVTEGCFATRPADPTAEGFTFGGWFTDPQCTIPWNFDTDTVTTDITLYALWSEASPILMLDAPTVEELRAALAKAAASSYITTVQVMNASLTVDTALTIHEGKALLINTGSLSLGGVTNVLGSLNIAANATLINTGTIRLLSEDCMHIKGRFINNADLWIGGAGTNGSTAYGSLTIESIGKLENSGKIVIDPDTASTFYNNGTVINSGEFFIRTPDLFFNNGEYTENRTDTVYAMNSNGSMISYLGVLSDVTQWTDSETLTILGLHPEGGVTLPEALLVLTDVSITLDLNGHTVTLPISEDGYAYSITIEHGASLTITDSSTDGSGKLTSAADCTINCMGTLVLEYGTIENTASGYYSPAIYPNGSGFVRIFDGTVSGKSHAISSMDISGNSSSIIIAGGHIYGGKAAIYNSGSGGLLHIAGGELVSDSTVIVSAGEYSEDFGTGTLISGNAVLRLTSEVSETAAPALISGATTIESCILMAKDPSFFDDLKMELPQETGPDDEGYYTVDLIDPDNDPTAWVLTDPTEEDLLRVLNQSYVTKLEISNTVGPPIRLNEYATIPDGMTVTLTSGEIVVGDSAELVVNGILEIWTSTRITNNGTISIGSADFPNGKLVKDGGSITNNGIYLDNSYLLDTNTASYITVTNMTEDGSEITVYCGPADGTAWKISEEYDTVVIFHDYGTSGRLILPDSIPANSLGMERRVFFGVDPKTDEPYTTWLTTASQTFTLGENVRLEFTSPDHIDQDLLYSDCQVFHFEGEIHINPGAALIATNCCFQNLNAPAATNAIFTVNGGSMSEMPNLELYGCTVSQGYETSPCIELIGGYASLNSFDVSENVGTGSRVTTVHGPCVGIKVDESSRLEAENTDFNTYGTGVGLENNSELTVSLTACTFRCGSTAIINSGSDLALYNCDVQTIDGISGTAILNHSSGTLFLNSTHVSAGIGVENQGYFELVGDGQSVILGQTYALYNTGSAISLYSFNNFDLSSADGFYAVYSDTSDNPDAVVSLYGYFEAPTEEQIFNDEAKLDTDEVKASTDDEGNVVAYYIYREYVG